MQVSYYWLAGMIIFFIIEAIVPGLISVWCGIAAAITAIFAIYVKDIRYQVYFFSILSVILFIMTRKFSNNMLNKNKEDRVDRIKDSIIEIKGIDSVGNYQVYLDGKNWTGISDKKFAVGDKVKVIGIKGIKLLLDEINIYEN
ncbi:MAG: NfeD family protein [Fusobacteriaceae bacterium]|jgi:membrane protein implicated in regulation of membrane protease activity|nr:NfeD family protein [Fusobacteriaceae bacterium]